jgi:cell division protein FtsW
VIGLFVLLAYAGIRTALRAPDTFGALLAAGITAWLCFQAFINIGVVVALVPVTGITLPFISAGGSSLLISFAAAGVLLSISRETMEPRARGAKQEARPSDARTSDTRRTDEAADRGRGHRGSHLPGAGRRERTPSPTRPA